MDDYADSVIARMRSPKDMHIICVDVTNKCDLHCSNCTRLLKNQPELWDMSLENFRLALRSLTGFQGVIAMIGGNPCMHRQFPELCEIFAEEVPVQRQRGLWSNNVFKHQELIRDTFGFFNLNPHNDERGRKSLAALKELIPQVNYFNGHSHHAPMLTAMSDMYPNPREMWDVIQTCDINREWSATVIQNQGQLRVYFCEVAASFDLARGEDHGRPVADGWWKQSISEFSDQVKHFCPGCGVPARLKGHLDAEEIDTYSPSNEGIAKAALKRRRKIIEIHSIDDAKRLGNRFTNYNEYYARKDSGPAQREGTVGMIYSADQRYYCLPVTEATEVGRSVERINIASALPTFVEQLIRSDDNVLLLGPGFGSDIVDISRRARRIRALDPNGAAVELLTLTCRLNDCSNARIERLAAYDHNTMAEFITAADPYDGLVSPIDTEGMHGSEASAHVNCVRIDDYFDDDVFNVVINRIAGAGDVEALLGGLNTLKAARLLFFDFNHKYYGEKPNRLSEIAANLDKIFPYCYALHAQIRNAQTGCAEVLKYLVAQQSSGMLIFSQVSLI